MPGARRAGLRRGRDRRHGHAVAIEEVPRGLLRRHGRQHAARPGGRHEGAGQRSIRASTSTARASTAIRAAATRPPTPCSTIPDFFKVGISEAGNHDKREYEDDWAEKWQAAEAKNADGTSNYDTQANQNYAKNLKGHLLLAHGTMDNNVPPYKRCSWWTHSSRPTRTSTCCCPQPPPTATDRPRIHDAAALGLLCAPSGRRYSAGRV